MEFTPIVFLGPISALCFFLGIRKLSLARTIEDLPTSRIRSAPQGYVEIKGRSVLNGQSPLYVPRLEVPCVWFRYQVTYERQDETRQNVFIERTRGIYLEDPTGLCLANTHLAEIHPKRRVTHTLFGETHEMSWIGVGDYIYALGWMNTLHPAPQTNDVLRKDSEDDHGLRYGQLKEPLGTLTRHPDRRYPYLIAADFEYRFTRTMRVVAASLIGVGVLTGVGSLVL